MAKEIFAVTNIKVAHDKTFEAGAKLDARELKEYLSSDQMKELLDAGAIEVREQAVEPEEVVEAPAEEAPATEEAAPAEAAPAEEAPAEEAAAEEAAPAEEAAAEPTE